MQPTYYLPNLELRHLAPSGQLSRGVLSERGLGDVWRDVDYGDLHRGECACGPDRQKGLLLVAGEGRARYEPEQQDWHQLSDALWVGLAKDAPPTPLELVRKNAVPGHNVELRGNVWVIPVLRSVQQRTTLPEVPRWVNGSMTLTVRQEWRSLWEQSARMWDIVTSLDASLQEVLELAADVLAANYRVDRALLGVLEILDTSNWEAVLRAAVDWPAVEAFLEAQKKSGTPSQAGMANTTPGATGDAPDTPPAEANSTSPACLTATSPPSCPSLSGGDA